MSTDVRTADIAMTPLASVRIANEIAVRASREVSIRALSATVVRHCQDIPGEGPRLIAEWVRENILYTQEAPGEEILQGPMGTLPWWLEIANAPEHVLGPMQSLGGVHRFQGAGTGDCDDLATLWASMCRSLGLSAYVVGMGDADSDGFYHAIGTCDGKFYELSLDHTYGATRRPALIASIPPRTRLVWWDAVAGSYVNGGTPRGMSGRPRRKRRRQRRALTSGMRTMAGGRRIQGEDVVNAGAAVADGMRQAGIPLDSSVFGDTVFASAVGGIARDASVAAGVATSVATSVATATAVASSAVPIIGWIVAGVIFAGLASVRVGRAMKYRNRASDYGRHYVDIRDTVCTICQVPDALRPLLASRIDEVIPRAAGTYGMRGRGSRTVRQAQFLNAQPRAPFTWSTGSSASWDGVFEVFRRTSSPNEKMAQVMLAHRNSVKQLGIALAGVNLRERRRALSMLFQEFLGPDSITAFRGWLDPDYLQGQPAPERLSPGSSFNFTKVLPYAALAVGGLVIAKGFS